MVCGVWCVVCGVWCVKRSVLLRFVDMCVWCVVCEEDSVLLLFVCCVLCERELRENLHVDVCVVCESRELSVECVCVCVFMLRDHERYGDESRGKSTVSVSVSVCDACMPCMPCMPRVCIDRGERGAAAACSKHLASCD